MIKTQFGKWIHGVLTYYIHFVHFEQKSYRLQLYNYVFKKILMVSEVSILFVACSVSIFYQMVA